MSRAHRCARRNLHFHSTVKTCITNPQNFQKMIAAYKSEIPYIFIHIDFINLYWSYPFTNARKWKKSRSLLFLSIYVICWNNQLAHRKIRKYQKKTNVLICSQNKRKFSNSSPLISFCVTCRKSTMSKKPVGNPNMQRIVQKITLNVLQGVTQERRSTCFLN